MVEDQGLRYIKIFVGLAVLGFSFVVANAAWDRIQSYIKGV